MWLTNNSASLTLLDGFLDVWYYLEEKGQKYNSVGAGEKAQQPRALTTLAEVQGLVPNNHMMTPNCL